MLKAFLSGRFYRGYFMINVFHHIPNPNILSEVSAHLGKLEEDHHDRAS